MRSERPYSLNESRGRCILARSPLCARETIMRTTTLIALIIIGMPFQAGAQNKAVIEKKLISEYALTQATADQTDIVTAGAILVMKKGNIVMAPVSGTNFFQNTYK